MFGRRSLFSRLLLLALSLSISVIGVAGGCATTTLYPPTNPVEPRIVFLIDHGRHSSLVITRSNGALVRYAYGDWRYYADQDISIPAGAAALFWSTPATLARAELFGPPELSVLRSQLKVSVQSIYAFEVTGSDADRVAEQLDELHILGESDHQYVPAYDMTFAPHPVPYRWFNNSASAVASWVEDMGVKVEGPRLFASWRVAEETTR